MGLGEARLGWNENHTWGPARGPKKVQITMDLEERGGARLWRWWEVVEDVSMSTSESEEDGEGGEGVVVAVVAAKE